MQDVSSNSMSIILLYLTSINKNINLIEVYRNILKTYLKI